jgi:hypothetical protein
MKNFLKLFTLVLTITANAQSPIINLSDDSFGETPNAYYKDVNNVYNSFEGIWKYEFGSTLFEIKLRKRLSVFVPGVIPYYEDFLCGEYRYVENGIQKINTITNITNNYLDYYKYNLSGTAIIENNMFPICSNCPANTKRVSMEFNEQGNDDAGIRAILVLRKITENNIEKLQVKLIKMNPAVNMNKNNLSQPSIFRNFTVPYGEYTLVKQP